MAGEGINIETRELEWAIFDALTLAEIHGTTVELGEGCRRTRSSAGAGGDDLEAFRPAGT